MSGRHTAHLVPTRAESRASRGSPGDRGHADTWSGGSKGTVSLHRGTHNCIKSKSRLRLTWGSLRPTWTLSPSCKKLVTQEKEPTLWNLTDPAQSLFLLFRVVFGQQPVLLCVSFPHLTNEVREAHKTVSELGGRVREREFSFSLPRKTRAAHASTVVHTLPSPNPEGTQRHWRDGSAFLPTSLPLPTPPLGFLSSPERPYSLQLRRSPAAGTSRGRVENQMLEKFLG